MAPRYSIMVHISSVVFTLSKELVFIRCISSCFNGNTRACENPEMHFDSGKNYRCILQNQIKAIGTFISAQILSNANLTF